MGMLSKIKSLLSSTRPILFLFWKGNFKALQCIRGVHVLFTFPRQYSFLACYTGNYTATLITDEHVRQPVMRNTHSNSFPCALQSLETWINFSFAVSFGDRALFWIYLPSTSMHGRLVQWAGNTHKLHVSPSDFTIESTCQTLECDSLSDMGQRIFVQLCLRKICCLCKHNSETRQATHKKASGLAYLLNTFLGNLKLVHGHRIIIIIFQQ